MKEPEFKPTFVSKLRTQSSEVRLRAKFGEDRTEDNRDRDHRVSSSPDFRAG
jgi:hypothetical protein